MPILLNGDTGITTPGLTNTGSTTLVSLTTTGNTILGDQSTDTLNVANGNLVLNSSGNLGIGTASPARRLQVNSGEAVAVRFTRGGGIVANNSLEWFDGTNGWYAGVSGSNFWGVAYNSSGSIDSAAIRLDTAGNLGLGGTPSSKLTVASTGSTIELKQNGTGSATYYVMDNTIETGGKRWRFGYTGGAGIPTFSLFNQTDNLVSWVADASGNLGIGTSSPTVRLEAYKTDGSGARTNPVDVMAISAAAPSTSYAYNGFGAALIFNAANYTTTAPVAAARIRSSLNDNSVDAFGSSLVFDVTATRGGALSQAMTLSYSGNLGIGIYSPATNLDVRGSTTATIRVGSTSSGGSGDEFGNLEFYWADPDSPEVKAKIYAKNVGNVGPGGGGAADLLFATRPAFGALTEDMRLTADGNLLVGTTTSAGSTSNGAGVVGGVFRSFSASVATSNNTTTTILTLPSTVATYIVTAWLIADDAVNYTSTYLVQAQGGSSVVTTVIRKGNLLAISNSGYNIQVNQNSGASFTVNCSAVRIA